jgi:hypothetical protein
MERVNIADKFARFPEQWQPKIVAELNGQELKLVKVQVTFPWHATMTRKRCFWSGEVAFAWSSESPGSGHEAIFSHVHGPPRSPDYPAAEVCLRHTPVVDELWCDVGFPPRSGLSA